MLRGGGSSPRTKQLGRHSRNTLALITVANSGLCLLAECGEGTKIPGGIPDQDSVSVYRKGGDI